MKFFLIFLVLLISFKAHSQTYQETLVDGKEWIINDWYGGGLGAIQTAESTSYVLKCDTLLSGKTYSILYKQGSTHSPIHAYIREDVINKQVFYLPATTASTSSEELIADYGLSIGDTIFYLGAVEVVINIASGTTTFASSLRFIEGTGSSNMGIVKNHIPPSPGPDATIFGSVNLNTGISCMTTISVIKTENRVALSVYPNPTTNRINIELKSNKKPQQAILRDIRGAVVSIFNLEETSEFSIENIPVGIYVLEVEGFTPTKIVKI